MKKKFIAKKKQKKSYKFLFFFIILIVVLTNIYKIIENSNYKLTNKDLIKIILYNTNHHHKKYSITKNISKIKLTSIISNNYKKLVIKKTKNNTYKANNPIIYLYNTHQTEEYAPSNYVEYSIKPTVQMVNYIMEDYFNKKNFKTLVEERKIKDILISNKWNYAYSYKASRIFLEDVITKNKELKYFIDIHRDSLSKEKTTITINNIKYARIIFIIGLENNNYQENLEFTTKINNLLDKYYPNLSKGIYKKGGEGVNGVYNQDFNKNTILVEIGGKDNNIDEVLNTTLAFSKCFVEVITNNES